MPTVRIIEINNRNEKNEKVEMLWSGEMLLGTLKKIMTINEYNNLPKTFVDELKQLQTILTFPEIQKRIELLYQSGRIDFGYLNDYYNMYQLLTSIGRMRKLERFPSFIGVNGYLNNEYYGTECWLGELTDKFDKNEKIRLNSRQSWLQSFVTVFNSVLFNGELEPFKDCSLLIGLFHADKLAAKLDDYQFFGVSKNRKLSIFRDICVDIMREVHGINESEKYLIESMKSISNDQLEKFIFKQSNYYLIPEFGNKFMAAICKSNSSVNREGFIKMLIIHSLLFERIFEKLEQHPMFKSGFTDAIPCVRYFYFHRCYIFKVDADKVKTSEPFSSHDDPMELYDLEEFVELHTRAEIDKMPTKILGEVPADYRHNIFMPIVSPFGKLCLPVADAFFQWFSWLRSDIMFIFQSRDLKDLRKYLDKSVAYFTNGNKEYMYAVDYKEFDELIEEGKTLYSRESLKYPTIRIPLSLKEFWKMAITSEVHSVFPKLPALIRCYRSDDQSFSFNMALSNTLFHTIFLQYPQMCRFAHYQKICARVDKSINQEPLCYLRLIQDSKGICARRCVPGVPRLLMDMQGFEVKTPADKIQEISWESLIPGKSSIFDRRLLFKKKGDDASDVRQVMERMIDTVTELETDGIAEKKEAETDEKGGGDYCRKEVHFADDFIDNDENRGDNSSQKTHYEVKNDPGIVKTDNDYSSLNELHLNSNITNNNITTDKDIDITEKLDETLEVAAIVEDLCDQCTSMPSGVDNKVYGTLREDSGKELSSRETAEFLINTVLSDLHHCEELLDISNKTWTLRRAHSNDEKYQFLIRKCEKTGEIPELWKDKKIKYKKALARYRGKVKLLIVEQKIDRNVYEFNVAQLEKKIETILLSAEEEKKMHLMTNQDHQARFDSLNECKNVMELELKLSKEKYNKLVERNQKLEDDKQRLEKEARMWKIKEKDMQQTIEKAKVEMKGFRDGVKMFNKEMEQLKKKNKELMAERVGVVGLKKDVDNKGKTMVKVLEEYEEKWKMEMEKARTMLKEFLHYTANKLDEKVAEKELKCYEFDTDGLIRKVRENIKILKKNPKAPFELLFEIKELPKSVFSQDTLKKMKNIEKQECVICLHEMTIRDKLFRCIQCSHKCHYSCYRQWAKQGDTCPVCRKVNPNSDEFPPLR